eukprot:356137-Pleurochrysis_carterae.AAC.3
MQLLQLRLQPPHIRLQLVGIDILFASRRVLPVLDQLPTRHLVAKPHALEGMHSGVGDAELLLRTPRPGRHGLLVLFPALPAGGGMIYLYAVARRLCLGVRRLMPLECLAREYFSAFEPPLRRAELN